MKTCRKGLHIYDEGLKQCPDCQRIVIARYQASEKGRAATARHRRSEKYRVKEARYRGSEKGRAKQLRRNASEKKRAANYRYRTSEHGHAVRMRGNSRRLFIGDRYMGWMQTPEQAAAINQHIKDRLHGFIARQQAGTQIESISASTVPTQTAP